MQRSFLYTSLAIVCALTADSAAHAQVFLPDYLVVERIGDGAGALGSAAFAVFLDQYHPSIPGAAVTTTPMPTAAGTLAVTDSGSATSNGYFTRTADGTALVVPGYNANVGTLSVAGSAPGTINRSIGLVTSATSVNSSNGFSDGPTNNFRSVASYDGSAFYASTAGSAAAAGILLKNNTGSVTTTTPVLLGNTRNLRIFNGANGPSLFAASSAAAPGAGIHLVGTAGTLPTSSVTSTVLPGTGTSGTGTASPYGFFLVDNPLNSNNYQGTGFDTLYVADDRANTAGGGIQRWSFDGANWNLNGTAQYGVGATPSGFRGLTASISGNTVSLFATSVTSATSGGVNDLVLISDTLTAVGGTFGSFTTLATSATNTVFRGVDFTPQAIPEPTSLSLAAVGLAGIWWRRRVQNQRAGQ